MSLKQLLHDLTPPLLLRQYRKWRSKPTHVSRAPEAGRPEWECLPQGWRAAGEDPRVKGWNVPEVMDAYRKRWDDFLRTTRGATPFGTSPEAPAGSGIIDLPFHNSVLTFGYCLARSARNGNRVSMLDWGGGLGHYYLIASALLPEIALDYHCKDVPLLAEEGRKLLPEAHYCSDESCLSRTYDFVMASTSMHYSQDWRATLGKLAGASGRFLLVTGLPVIFDAASFVFVQRPYAYGYNTEYVGWCLNRREFLDAAAALGLILDRELIVGHQPPIAGAPEQCQYRGYLFRVEPESNSSLQGAGRT